MIKNWAELGVRGAVGIIAGGVFLGTAASKLVETFVVGILDPVIAYLFSTTNLSRQTSQLGEGLNASIVSWGAVVVVTLNLLLTVVLLYFGGRWVVKRTLGPKTSAAKKSTAKKK